MERFDRDGPGLRHINPGAGMVHSVLCDDGRADRLERRRDLGGDLDRADGRARGTGRYRLDRGQRGTGGARPDHGRWRFGTVEPDPEPARRIPEGGSVQGPGELKGEW